MSWCLLSVSQDTNKEMKGKGPLTSSLHGLCSCSWQRSSWFTAWKLRSRWLVWFLGCIFLWVSLYLGYASSQGCEGLLDMLKQGQRCGQRCVIIAENGSQEKEWLTQWCPILLWNAGIKSMNDVWCYHGLSKAQRTGKMCHEWEQSEDILASLSLSFSIWSREGGMCAQRSQGWLWCLKQWRAPGVISPRLGAPLSSTPESLPCTVQSVPTQVTQPWVWIQGVSFLDCLRENSLIFTSLCKRAKIYLSYWFVLRVEKKKYYEAFNMFVVHHNT